MKFSEVIEQASTLLQQKERITYRSLKREFDLDEDALEDLKALERAGWESLGREGKHFKLRKVGNPSILYVPVHGGKPLKAGLLRGLLKKAEITEEEFLKLYR